MNTNNEVETDLQHKPAQNKEVPSDSFISGTLVIYMVAIFGSAFGVFPLGEGREGSTGSLLRQLVWLLLAGASLTFFLQRDLRKEPMVTSAGGYILLLMLGYVLLSAGWSVIPGISFKRGILLVIVVGLCIAAFGRRQAQLPNFIGVHALAIALLVGLSFLAALIYPSIGITPIGWCGITSHKNELGQVAAVSTLVFISLTVFDRRPLYLAILLLSVICLYFSRSSTSQMALLVGFCVAIIFLFIDTMSRHRRMKFLLPSIVLLALAFSGCMLILGVMPDFNTLIDKVLVVFGKSSTLTGRTKLWSLVLDNSKYHNPLIGCGFGGFWNGLKSISGYIAYRFPGGYVGQAHNGYIDIFNDLGYIGIGLLSLLLIFYLRQILAVKAVSRHEFYFHLTFFVFIVALNYTESVFFRTTQFLNIVLMASYVRVNALAATYREAM